MILSTSLNVQLHVLLVGENEEDIEDEAYEVWDEEMLEDDEEEQIIEQNNDNVDDKPLQDDKNKSIEVIESKNNKLQQQEKEDINNTAEQSRAVQDVPDINSKVLRVFAGNVDVGASYHSLRVNESTSVAELLLNAMEKFHISQIETKNGHHHGHHSCVEYYLTVKTRDGDEITLDSQDKPFAIYESLTAHLTTPMPSLTQFRQLANSNNVDHVTRKKKRRSSSISSIGDSSLQFFMHKRIKRVNDKSGQVHIKVSLMTQANNSNTVPEKMNAIKKMTALRFSKKKAKKESGAELERIDKLIAIAASITISELTSIALVKFHIIPDKDQPHQYRLILNANGKGNNIIVIHIKSVY